MCKLFKNVLNNKVVFVHTVTFVLKYCIEMCRCLVNNAQPINGKMISHQLLTSMPSQTCGIFQFGGNFSKQFLL